MQRRVRDLHQEEDILNETLFHLKTAGIIAVSSIMGIGIAYCLFLPEGIGVVEMIMALLTAGISVTILRMRQMKEEYVEVFTETEDVADDGQNDE